MESGESSSALEKCRGYCFMESGESSSALKSSPTSLFIAQGAQGVGMSLFAGPQRPA